MGHYSLFIIYTNEVAEDISHSTSLMFADDTKFLKVISGVDDCLLLQKDLSSFHRWCSNWTFQINPSKKCESLLKE